MKPNMVWPEKIYSEYLPQIEVEVPFVRDSSHQSDIGMKCVSNISENIISSKDVLDFDYDLGFLFFPNNLNELFIYLINFNQT